MASIFGKYILFVVIGVLTFSSTFASAQETSTISFELKIFSQQGVYKRTFSHTPSLFGRDMSLDTGNVMEDAREEIIVGAGEGMAPEVFVFSGEGELLKSFLAYNEKFRGGVRVTSCDLDDDGREEIITAAGPGGGPHVRVFNEEGTPVVNDGVFVFSHDFSGGVEVACGDVDGDKKRDIVVASDTRSLPEVRVFTREGVFSEKKFFVKDVNTYMGISLEVVDFYGDGKAEIVVSGGYGNSSRVSIFEETGHEVRHFLTYRENFFGGVNLGAYDDGVHRYLITAPGITGGAHVKVFDIYGDRKQEFFAWPLEYNAGIKVASGNVDIDEGIEFVVIEQAKQEIARTDARFIEVDVSEQKERVYDSGYLVNEFLVSSGKKYFETPVGEFTVWRKRPNVTMSWYYGASNPNNYRLPNVPWVLSFKGPYTLHGTYWHKNFGHPMSHGCVNMYTSDAKWLYNWAPIGTPVLVHE